MPTNTNGRRSNDLTRNSSDFSLNNIYSDKSTLNILYNEIILRIQKQAICFYKSVSLYRHNTLIEQYININTGMLCNKYMNMKKVKKEEKKNS